MKYYAGIGSRDTPTKIMKTMTAVAHELGNVDFCLRSGGASGADTAFEDGWKSSKGKAQIILPWDGFNGRKVDNESYFIQTPDAFQKAFNMAIDYKMSFESRPQSVQKLHARNFSQILGLELDSRVNFCLYWAPLDPKGQVKGGTRIAVNMAKKILIPTYRITETTKVDDVLSWAEWIS